MVISFRVGLAGLQRLMAQKCQPPVQFSSYCITKYAQTEMEKAARPYKKTQGGRGVFRAERAARVFNENFPQCEKLSHAKKLTKFEVTGVESCKKAPIYPENNAF